jgi:putative ABC transport system substrate-binding protein
MTCQLALRRRNFIALAGAAAAAWSVPARAQHSAMPVIGLINGGSPAAFVQLMAAFRQGLSESGFVEGRNVVIEYRWAEGQYERLPAMVAELARRPVALMVATAGANVAAAAHAATKSIPIVVVVGADPVRMGLVASLGRPGGNVTGAGNFTTELDAKRFEIVHMLVPSADSVALLLNPARQYAGEQRRTVEAAAAQARVRLVVVEAATEGEIDLAFASIAERRAGALVVGADPFLFAQRDRIVALAARHRVPAIYEWRDFAAAGGLLSYGTVLADAYRQAGLYAGRILKGARPADLPFVQSTRFELVVNLKTAATLGLTIPPAILLRADEVIE